MTCRRIRTIDKLTNARTCCVTRLRGNTAYQVVTVLPQGPRYRDEIIRLGRYHSNPCQHPVRLISVVWNQTWYRYATNVLVEMVFRGCYHVSQAVQRGDERSLVAFLVDHARLLGVVKAIRKRHKHIQTQQQEIWGTTLS